MAAAQDVRVLPLRPGVLLLELQDLEETLALFEAFERDPVDGVQEIVPAARTLMVTCDPAVLNRDGLLQAVAARLGRGRSSGGGDCVEIPVHYDGEDLGEVANLLGCSVAEVVRRHTQADYTVAFTGFSPGFAYLAAPDAQLAVARRASPRVLVPAGSVGLAGEFSGVYPKASPGGWQLIGRTPLVLFDLAREPAALLRPGLRVRFRDLSKGRLYPVAVLSPPVAEEGRAACQSGIEVLESGLPALMQDLGRPGRAAEGISLSGALDRASLRLANRLAGNPPGAATLEIAPAGFSFRVWGRAVMAITGAPAALIITGVDGVAFEAPLNAPVALEDGDRVRLQPPEAGARSYLALRGGFAVQPVLGSVATDTLAQIGPAAVQAGDRLGIREAPVSALVEPCGVPAFVMPRAGETVVLDVHLGPRTDWFTPAALASFLSQSWEVTPQSSRIGIRLAGAPLERGREEELPSEATLRGAVQVPASGQPVLFLADHPLTGGYPVIANVAIHHLDLAGQIPPGARIRFNAVASFTPIGAPI